MATSMSQLPPEILAYIFSFLDLSDLKDASLVCKAWYQSALSPSVQKKLVMTLNGSSLDTKALLKLADRAYFHLSISDSDGCSRIENLLLNSRAQISNRLVTLNLKGAHITEQALISILGKCDNLQSLDLSCCNSLLMSGRTLVNGMSSIILDKLRSLKLSSMNHLSDATLEAFLNSTPALESLELASVPMLFSSLSLYSHPGDGPSSAALTFNRFIKQVSKLRETLCSLNLSRTGVTDGCLETLAKLEGLKLTGLHLVACKDMTSRGVITLLNSQPLLVDLNLGYNTQLSDAVVKLIGSKLGKLSYLNVQGLKITAGAMKSLHTLKAGTMVLSNCVHVDFMEESADHVFQQWNETTKSLNLSHCVGLSVRSLNSLCQSMTNLIELNLTSCFYLNDIVMREISKNLHKLKSLSIGWCKKVTDLGLLGIVSADFAKEVDDCRCARRYNLTNSDIPYFTYTPPVKDLAPAEAIPSEQHINDAIDNLEKEQPYPICLLIQLSHLDLSCCSKLTDRSLARAVSFNSLRSLNLSLCFRLTDASLIAISKLNPLLESIWLNECKEITDAGLKALITTCHRLSSLHISNCPLVTDQTLVLIIKSRAQLKYLDISYCNISLKAIEQMERFVPTLQTLHKRYTTTDPMNPA